MEKQGTNLRPLYSLREPISTSQVLPSALTRLKPLAERGRGPTSAAPSQRERGPAGVTNLELNKICLRHGARIFELRRQRVQVETRREGETVFRFILRGEPQQLKSLPSYSREPKGDELPLFAEVLR